MIDYDSVDDGGPEFEMTDWDLLAGGVLGPGTPAEIRKDLEERIFEGLFDPAPDARELAQFWMAAQGEETTPVEAASPCKHLEYRVAKVWSANDVGACGSSTNSASVDGGLVAGAQAERVRPPDFSVCTAAEERVIRGLRETIYGVLVKDNQSRALDLIRHRIGEFADCLAAGVGWLFTPTEDRTALGAVVGFNVPPGLTIGVQERSIVSYVWSQGDSYCQGNVEKDGFFCRSVAGVRSAISAAVMDGSDRDSMLGVLHFESYLLNAFSPADRRDMETFALALAPLVRMATERAAVFNPWAQGWDLDKSLGWVLRQVADCWSGSSGVRPMLTLWYVDHAKCQAWSVAATGFGSPSGEVFGRESYLVKEIATQLPLKVIWARPEIYLASQHCRKAVGMGIRETAFVLLPGGGGDKGWPRWILGFHCPRNVPGDDRPGSGFLQWLAAELSVWIQDLFAQWSPLAKSYLRQVVRRLLARPEEGMAPAIEAVRQILNASQGSLFGFPAKGSRLYPLATTTVLCAEENSAALGSPTHHANALAPADLYYDVRTEAARSFTAWLAVHAPACARKNDVTDEKEWGVPLGFPPRPLNKLRESGAMHQTERRRFIGASVGNLSECIGVARFVRSEEALPFRREDEVLLGELVEELKPLLEQSQHELIASNWRGTASQAVQVAISVSDENVASSGSSIGSSQPSVLRPAVRQLLKKLRGELVGSRAGEGESRDVAIALYEFFPGRRAKSVRIRLYDYAVTDTSKSWVSRETIGQVRKLAHLVPIQRLYYASRPARQGASDGLTALAIAPVQAWNGFAPVEGVLTAVVPANRGWDDDALQQVFLATHRLGTLFLRPQRRELSSRNRTICDDWKGLAESFQRLFKARWVTLTLNGDGGGQWQEGAPPKEPLVWLPVDDRTFRSGNNSLPDELIGRTHQQRNMAISRYGVGLTRERDAVRIRLRIGALVVGELAWGPPSSWFLENATGLVSDVIASWYSFLVRHPDAWEVRVSRKETRVGLIAWEPQVVWSEPQSSWQAHYIDSHVRVNR